MRLTSPSYLSNLKVHPQPSLKKDQGEEQQIQIKLSLSKFKKMKLKEIGAMRKEEITLWKEEEVLYKPKLEKYYNMEKAISMEMDSKYVD